MTTIPSSVTSRRERTTSQWPSSRAEPRSGGVEGPPHLFSALPFRRARRLAVNANKSAVLLLVILIATPFTRAQPPTHTGPYRIAGAVVSSADGRPLPNASVVIDLNESDPGPSKLTRTTTSDADGRFEFTGLPAGNFTLRGESRGFLATFYDDHDGFTTGIITGSTVPTDALILKLTPRASLSGVITNEAGEPVQNASVRLFRQSHNFGDDRIVAAGTQQTDDLGRFDFPSLASGDYLIAVMAQPWYAVHPQPSPITQIPRIPDNASAQQQQMMRAMVAQIQRLSTFGVTGPVDPSLDVAYPITYYPGGTDSADAEPIPLRPSDSRQISLQLSPVPALTLNFPRAADPSGAPEAQPNGALAFVTPGRPAPVPQLRVSIFGNIEPAPAQIMQYGANGTTITGLAPGDYLVAQGNTPINQSLGAQSIHLTSSNDTISTPAPDASALAHVHVQLAFASGSPPANLPVGLVRTGSNDAISRNVPSKPNPSGKDETILDVPPGDYSFTIAPLNSSGRPGARSWFLRGITADGKPLPANSIHVAAGDSPSVTLTVIPGSHTLRGYIVHTGALPNKEAYPNNESVILSEAGPPGRAESKDLPLSSADPADPAVISGEPRSGESRAPRISSESAAGSPQTTPAPGIFLLLIPTGPFESAPRRFWRQQSDLDGSFSISGLASGSYTLFAIDDGWTLDWQLPHALDRYLPAAAHITIPDSTSPIISLPAPVPAQPK